MSVTQQRPLKPLPSSRPAARWGTLALALGAGLAAALLAFLLVRGRIASGASTPALVSVVVAARDIPARTRLTDSAIQIRRVPPADAPDGFLADRAGLAGKVTLRAVAEGKAVLPDALAAPGAALGMAFSLPPSQRAVTVALDPADGVDQFARPGDHVDILATDEPGRGPAETRTVLQNVALLAVGAQTSPDEAPAPASGSAGASHVTVAVSPADAQALVLAAARGRIHLALRPPDDPAVAALPTFPASAPPAPEPPIPAPRPRGKPRRSVPLKAVALPPTPLPVLPLPPLPVSLPPPRPLHTTILVVKGSQSQTVSVTP